MDLEILDIASDTENNRNLRNHTHFSKLKNSMCGDEIQIKLIIKDEQFYTISENVIFKNINKALTLRTEEIIFKVNDNTIETIGDTKIEVSNNYFFDTSNILYDLNAKEISSENKSLIQDLQLNKIEINNFVLNLKENILKTNEANIVDKNLNQYDNYRSEGWNLLQDQICKS